MKTVLKSLVQAILLIPAIALASPLFDVQTTATLVVVKNLSTDSYIKVVMDIDGCGRATMSGPGGVVAIDLPKGDHRVDVRFAELTPMRELRAEAKANPRRVPKPITDPKTIASMQPVCLDWRSLR